MQRGLASSKQMLGKNTAGKNAKEIYKITHTNAHLITYVQHYTQNNGNCLSEKKTPIHIDQFRQHGNTHFAKLRFDDLMEWDFLTFV